MLVACLLGHGRAPLRGRIGEPAALGAKDLRFIGIRSVDAEEKLAIRTLGLNVYDMRHIGENGMRTTMTEALAHIDESTHLHVSFDLDCLDPADAPGVGTGVRGGPTYREMQLCMVESIQFLGVCTAAILQLQDCCPEGASGFRPKDCFAALHTLNFWSPPPAPYKRAASRTTKARSVSAAGRSRPDEPHRLVDGQILLAGRRPGPEPVRPSSMRCRSGTPERCATRSA